MRVFEIPRWCRVGAAAFGIVLWSCTGALAQGGAGPDQVQIEVESFGVGGVVRPGGWAGIRLALTDSAVRPRDVAVQLAVKDGDGDTFVPQRVVTLSPGRRLGVWLYARMPWSLGAGSILTVSVHAAELLEGGQVVVGRQIGSQRISPKSVADEGDWLLGVIGGQGMGLDGYARITAPKTALPAAHEAAFLVPQLDVRGLPDHWSGWDAFSVLVWADAQPAQLGALQTQALAEWVNRGGHLVVVLRSVGSPWLASDNPLAALLPRVEVQRRSGVDLNRYANLLTDRARLGTTRLPRNATIHRFVIPDDAQPAEATPVIDGPDGCVVARRIVGTGMVTLVGIDLRDRLVSNIVQADRFWHRVLGRRGDTMPRGAQSRRTNSLWSMGSGDRWADSHVAGLIAKGRAASVGVLLGLAVFILYWVISGPLGFAMLRSRGWERHSWVLFVASAGVFTLVTWSSVSVLRPRDEHLWHYTLMQHVYGQPVQRARVFASVLLPKYGQQRITVGEPGVDGAWNQVIGPWTDPEAQASLPFPDSRSYTINVRDMTSMRVPARSTIKQFEIEWLGGPRWGMPVPSGPDGAPRLVQGGGVIQGALVHSLPAALRDVRILVVQGQTSEAEEIAADTAKRVGRLRARGWELALTDPWRPGEPLDLGAKFSEGRQEPLTTYLRALVPAEARIAGAQRLGQVAWKEWQRDPLGALFPVVEPPDYSAGPQTRGVTRAVVGRRLTQRFDVGAWFTQPCLIILGSIPDAPCPVPVSVDGHRLDGSVETSTGRVVLQWVYPLKPDPVRFGLSVNAKKGRP